MEAERYIFPERLKELRTREHISGRTLSALMGLSKGMVSRYELGEVEPGARVIVRLADFFDVSTDYLLGANSPPIGPGAGAPGRP